MLIASLDLTVHSYSYGTILSDAALVLPYTGFAKSAQTRQVTPC